MKPISIIEHESRHYKPRTVFNARNSDLTIAFGVDFSTAGELLTMNNSDYCAQVRIDKISPKQAIELITPFFETLEPEVVNIAGNGIFTLNKHGITQDTINFYVFRVIGVLRAKFPSLRKIRSGGQTGADFAGALAGYALNIETNVLMPAGFRQRDATGNDFSQSLQQVTRALESQYEALKLACDAKMLDRVKNIS